jgi:hypothetical protein
LIYTRLQEKQFTTSSSYNCIIQNISLANKTACKIAILLSGVSEKGCSAMGAYKEIY